MNGARAILLRFPMMQITTHTFETLGSTNSEALKRARLGADEGLCILARQQTEGRGRHGRTWISEKDAGLYFSIVLRPRISPQFLPLITLMAGVAVHDMLQEYGIESDIKWVNDVLVGERKIAGILAETAETDNGIAVVVGIGVNLARRSVPPAIAETATSVQEASGIDVAPEEAAGTLAKYLSYFYDMMTSTDGSASIIDEWRKRSSYFSGKPVRVDLGSEMITGITDGLEPNGALRLRQADGRVVTVQAGDVERLRTEEE